MPRKTSAAVTRPRAIGPDELARHRIRQWFDADTTLTQERFGEEIGKNQAWVSRYFKGEFGADLDTLERIAHYFGQTIFTLLDQRADEEENALLECYRKLDPHGRRLAREVLKDWTGNGRRRRR